MQNGRYGPYVKKGTDSRSLESEDQLFTITPGRGQGDCSPAQGPRPRPGRRAAAARARRGPGIGRPIVIKDGRFGPYVTDGETNASLRKGDDVDSVTLQRAVELLAERRAAGPGQAPPPRRRRVQTGTGRSTARSGGTRRGASRSSRPSPNRPRLPDPLPRDIQQWSGSLPL